MNIASEQEVDPFKIMKSSKKGAPPLVMKLVTTGVDGWSVAGSLNNKKVEDYILYSALPEELRNRVKLAIQTLIEAG